MRYGKGIGVKMSNDWGERELPPLEDDRIAMMLGLVPDKRTPGERLWDAIRTRGESLKYHYESPDNKGDNECTCAPGTARSSCPTHGLNNDAWQGDWGKNE